MVLLSICIVALAIKDNLNLDSDVLGLLPAAENDAEVEKAFSSISERGMRQLLFLVTNPDEAEAIRGAEDLSAALGQSSWIKEVKLDHDYEEYASIADIYRQYRFHLLSRQDEKLLSEGKYLAISDAVLRQAYSPLSGGLLALLPEDPFLLSYRFGIARMGGEMRNFGLNNGHFSARVNGETFIFVRAELAQSPFNPVLQEQVLQNISTVEESWRDDPGETSLLRYGALFYAANAYNTARAEVTLIGGMSLLLIVALLLFAFRSLQPIFLILVTLLFGISAGFISVRLIFGEVHLLTVVFGASLIGVAVDYAFHYFAVGGVISGKARLGMIFPTITISLVSSIIGYIALLATPFPGLQQMAVFCIFGLMGAYLTVVLFFPAIPLKLKTAMLLQKACDSFISLGNRLPAGKVLATTMILPLFAVFTVPPDGGAKDDVRNFQPKSADLQKQEGMMQQLLNIPAMNQFYLVQGNTEEELLRNMESVQGKLNQDPNSSENRYLSITDWLPSIQQQAYNYGLYEKLYASEAASALVESGLISKAQLQHAKEIFKQARDDYLKPDEWMNSPAGKELSYLWLGGSDGNGADGGGKTISGVIALYGVGQSGLPAGLRESERGFYIDKITMVNDLLTDYREISSLLLIIASSVILSMMCFRYGWRSGILILAAPMAAVSFVLICQAVLYGGISLFNILALFLVVAIGVDLGIIFAETGRYNSSSFLVVLLSALTTMLSFGLLSMSETSVLHTFGLSMLLGILCILALSPFVGRLLDIDYHRRTDTTG